MLVLHKSQALCNRSAVLIMKCGNVISNSVVSEVLSA